jgi:hypothetical protein
MFDTEIPFEIHITTDHLSLSRQTDFVDFCTTQSAKPLMIELAKGDYIHQPMFSKVIYAAHFDHILAAATEISHTMNGLEFPVKRLKIEVSSEDADLLKNHSSNFDHYFEWHCKLNYEQMDQLLTLCEEHGVHLSLNSLRNESTIRFITLREFGTKQQFEERITALTADLVKGHWKILKQQSEYCIYDNNNFLDNGWLPQ